jgi:hypothetical protein
MSNYPPATPDQPIWQCPECGSTLLVEVTSGATVHTRVTGLDARGNLTFGPHTDVNVGRPERYQCEGCGEAVRDGSSLICTRRQLAAFLQRQAQ